MIEFLKSLMLGFWDTALEMSPYLLFGFIVAGLLSILISQRQVERHLGGQGFLQVVKASIFGVPLPLCSCSVIPVTMSLYKHKASKAAAVSFLLSTPQTGVDSIFVTYSLLGPVFAIFRPVVAFITGIIGGSLINWFDRTSAAAENIEDTCTGECCSSKKENKILRAIRHAFVVLPRDIAPSLIIGLIIAAFISALVPDDFFADKLPAGIISMLVMMFLGIPVYVCATASVPIAAAMMMKGLDPGAAFVFLVTGPATNAAGIVTIWNMLGKKTTLIYLLTVAGCALAGGFALNYFASGLMISEMTYQHHDGSMLAVAIQYFSTVVLFFVLGFAIISRLKQKSKAMTPQSEAEK